MALVEITVNALGSLLLEGREVDGYSIGLPILVDGTAFKEAPFSPYSSANAYACSFSGGVFSASDAISSTSSLRAVQFYCLEGRSSFATSAQAHPQE